MPLVSTAPSSHPSRMSGRGVRALPLLPSIDPSHHAVLGPITDTELAEPLTTQKASAVVMAKPNSALPPTESAPVMTAWTRPEDGFNASELRAISRVLSATGSTPLNVTGMYVLSRMGRVSVFLTDRICVHLRSRACICVRVCRTEIETALLGLFHKMWANLTEATSAAAQVHRMHHEIQALKSQLAVTEKASKDAAAKQRAIVETVVAQAITVRDHLAEQDRRHREFELARERQFRDQENQRRELEALKRNREQTAGVLRQLTEYLRCPICTEMALLPKVLGTCGHIACQNCLKQMDDVAFSVSNTAGASARQQLLARRCPMCRVEIVGQAFPVLPLKDVASLLIQTGYVEVPDQAALQKHIDAKAITYDKESAESKHIAALQLGCYAQSQLAQHSVNGVLSKITPEQWVSGVYVLFEAAVSRLFFETFSTTLHGKAGGLNVLVNASQRMLAVQLIDKSRSRDEKRDDKKGHIMVKVGTDGRFAITTTPISPTTAPTTTTNVSATPAVASVAATQNESPTAPTTTRT